ncbi:HD-GYP domain-containing protein [Konateibacter massiliensis]|uniref:HD-GYP domain-containing protein n=1 Tax=Konateibacter massiliensis TaxID=2002841 RepID=UPI000C14C2B3|nr:HD domain-containing phosphohydrolase [Konateibacter massiliensis]
MNNTSVLIVEQLNPGMIVAEDVYDNRGHLIISHELAISEKMIMRLKLFSIERVKVYEPEGMSGKETGKGHLAESLEFQEFKQKYVKNVDEFKDTINDIVYGNEPLDQNMLLSNINEFVQESPSRSQLFYMLRSLKEYDHTVYTHSYNVAIICKMFGIWLNKSLDDIEALTMAGLLHDIGKLAVLERMTGKETKEEREILMRSHTLRGYEVLKNKKIDERIKLVALEHHERRNGSGYLRGLKGNEMSEFSQIVAIADIYDKMTASGKIARTAPMYVFEYFKKEGYDLFESRFLLPFIEKTVETYLHNKVTLTNGVEGEIIMLNPQEKSRPLVRTPYGFIDLNTERNLEIKEIL